MFTGIVEDIGTVVAVTRGAKERQLQIETSLDPASFGLGDSVAVNGVCLTVTNREAAMLTFDASHETVGATTLKDLARGARVHLERALAMGGRLGGHLVTGHVDGVGRLERRERQGQALDLWFLAPDPVLPYLVAKGSVAVDGVSLTVNQPSPQGFRVTLVPHSLEKTHLKTIQPGQEVNLEADMLGKYVRHFLSAWQPGAGAGTARPGGVDEEFLAEHGFGPLRRT